MSQSYNQPLPAGSGMNSTLSVVPDSRIGPIPKEWTRFLVRVSEIVECDLLFFNTPEGESGKFRTTLIKGAKGAEPGAVGTRNNSSIGEGQTSAVLTTRRTLVRDDLTRGTGFDGEANLISRGIRSTLTAHIGSGEHIYGVLGLGSSRVAAFGKVQQAAVEALTAIFGSFVESHDGDEGTQARKDSLAARIVELEQERSDLEDFANLTAHYIKEPMGSIIGFGKLLDRPQEGRIDANADRWVSRMVAATV